MPLRSLLHSRFMLALMLGLALMHAAPSGVILCASENGLRFEFSCDCAAEAACGCGDCETGTECALSAPSDGCVCSDHSVDYAGTRTASAPRPEVTEVAPIVPVFSALATAPDTHACGLIAYNEAPPPLLRQYTTTILLI